MADGVLGAAGVERRLGGLVQGVHGVTGSDRGTPGTRPSSPTSSAAVAA